MIERGALGADTLHATDPDGDAVTLELVSDPADSAIARNFAVTAPGGGRRVVTWGTRTVPVPVRYTVGLKVSDGYGYTLSPQSFWVTGANAADIPAYDMVVTVPRNVPALDGGGVDLRDATESARIEVEVRDNLRALTASDSVIIENAGAVILTGNLNRLFVILDTDVDRSRDTVRVIVLDSTGTRDTVGMIPVLYPPRKPGTVPGLARWHMIGPDSLEADLAFSPYPSVEWWINRVTGRRELNQYNGDPLLNFAEGGPWGTGLLRFNSSAIRMIDNPNNVLGGGRWTQGGFTVFFVARLSTLVEAWPASLLSSSPFDYSFFSLGVAADRHVGTFTKGKAIDEPVVESVSGLLVDTTWHVFSYRSSGVEGGKVSVDVWLSGEKGQSTLSLPEPNVGDYLMVGSANKHQGNTPWMGDVAVFILYNRVLTDFERDDIEDYLGHRHRLAVR